LKTIAFFLSLVLIFGAITPGFGDICGAGTILIDGICRVDQAQIKKTPKVTQPTAQEFKPYGGAYFEQPEIKYELKKNMCPQWSEYLKEVDLMMDLNEEKYPNYKQSTAYKKSMEQLEPFKEWYDDFCVEKPKPFDFFGWLWGLFS